MINLRPANERGRARYSWLQSRHTFSFAHYYDPRHMGVSALRVINDDRVSPGAGFETHPHRDMEIISYVLSGQIEHKDTMGFHTVLKAGDVQVMSAGTGILHSEFNPSSTEELHFLQIWIQPNKRGVEPGYSEKNFSDVTGVTRIVSPDGRDGSLPIHQNASIYKIALANEITEFASDPKRPYYLHVARGQLKVNGIKMSEGDGATIAAEEILNFVSDQTAEALLFELP